MIFNSKFALVPSAVLVLGALALGCGEDDTDSDPKDFSGCLVPILAIDCTTAIKVPHEIEVLDATGKPFNPPMKTMSTDTGAVNLKVPSSGKYMLHVKGTGTDPMSSTYDQYIVNQGDGAPADTLVRISSAGTLSLAEVTGGFKADASRAAVGSTIYWSPNGVRMGTVGCAKVQLDGMTGPDVAQNQLYNGASGLPAPEVCPPGTPPMGVPPCVPATQTLKGGRFYIANATVGEHTVKVTLDNGATFLGEPVKFLVPAPRSAATSPTKAVLVQLGVDINTPTNPTPASCM